MERRATHEQRRDLRLRLARRQIPEILTWAGALTLVFGAGQLPHAAGRVAVVVGDEPRVRSALPRPRVGASGRGIIRARPRPLGVGRPAASLLVVMLAIVFSRPAHAREPRLHRRRDDGVRSAHACVGTLLGGGRRHDGRGGRRRSPHPRGSRSWTTRSSAWPALLISAVLLRLRMKALDDLAETQAQLDHQATYDPLTDVLNRNGLERAIPSVSATALRVGRAGPGVVRRRARSQAGERRERARLRRRPHPGDGRRPAGVRARERPDRALGR